jgi:hypothetical protein
VLQSAPQAHGHYRGHGLSRLVSMSEPVNCSKDHHQEAVMPEA